MMTFGEWYNSLCACEKMDDLKSLPEMFIYENEQFNNLMKKKGIDMDSEQSKNGFRRFMNLAYYFTGWPEIMEWLIKEEN